MTAIPPSSPLDQEGVPAEQSRAAGARLDSPGLRDAFDDRIRQAMHDVPLPCGLVERLREVLAQSTAADQGGNCDGPVAAESSSFGTTTARTEQRLDETHIAPKRASTERWPSFGAGRRQAVGAALVLAASLVCVMVFFRPGRRELGAEDILQFAGDFYLHVDRLVDVGEVVRDPMGDVRFPLSSAVYAGPQTRIRKLSSRFLGRTAWAYDLDGPQDLVATLYVVRQTLGGQSLPKLPNVPSVQVLATAGCTSTAWMDGPVLYVLVVKGGPGEYRQFIRDEGSLA